MVPDPRSLRKKKHDYAELMVCIIIGYLVGRTSLRRSLKWCKNHLEWLRRYMPLKNGIASASTACRMLCSIDEELFGLAFMEWIGEILSTKGIHIVIDGKALRAAASKVMGQRTPMVMNVLDAATGLVLAQMPIQDKECEISAIPELLKLLNLKDSIVTIDAIGTQTNIMERIIDGGGHFVLTVKRNNPSTYEELMSFFNEVSSDYEKSSKDAGYTAMYPERLKEYEEDRNFEKNRDRHEYRFYKICTATAGVSRIESDWPFIKSIGHIRQIRIPLERDAEGNDITPDLETFLKEGSRRKRKPTAGDEMGKDIQDVGIVSDIILTAKEMGRIKRSHWRIENSLHHVLDDTFREDRSPAKKSKNTLALVRKFVYNILRLAMMKYPEYKTMPEMMDAFADDLTFMENYVFNGIESYY